MPDTLLLLTFVFTAFSLVLMTAGVLALRRRRVLRLAAHFSLGLLMLALAALSATLTLATHGYRALTREELVALVHLEPGHGQHFRARFVFPDGHEESYQLAGDELYVDAHILKWKPLANLIGLHTAYELDRVGGRYVRLRDEQDRERTVYALGAAKPLDLFELRKRYAALTPLVDAEYGSATFVTAQHPQALELRVSNSGLLIRPATSERGH